MAKKKKLRVLISGVGGGSHGLEILKALRISGLDCVIYAADMDKKSFGFFLSDGNYVLPPATDSRYMSLVLNICRENKIKIVFHGSESVLKIISDNRSLLENQGVFLPFNSQEVIRLCTNKKETFDYLNNLNIPIPRTLAIRHEQDLRLVDFFPVIIKPYLDSGGSSNVFIAQNKRELLFFFRFISNNNSNLLVQEYIGTHENEYTVGILSDRDGRVISGVAIRRFILSSMFNRYKAVSDSENKAMVAISSGISQGEIINNHSLLSQCKNIAVALNSKGPLNIQCRLFKGKVYPFEINPRFSGTTYIKALAGVNEPELFIRKYILNEDIPNNIQPTTGLALRGLQEIFIPGKRLKIVNSKITNLV